MLLAEGKSSSQGENQSNLAHKRRYFIGGMFAEPGLAIFISQVRSCFMQVFSLDASDLGAWGVGPKMETLVKKYEV